MRGISNLVIAGIFLAVTISVSKCQDSTSPESTTSVTQTTTSSTTLSTRPITFTTTTESPDRNDFLYSYSHFFNFSI